MKKKILMGLLALTLLTGVVGSTVQENFTTYVAEEEDLGPFIGSGRCS